MRCPGQDMRYWKGDAASEVACPKCAAAVEFFKDDTSRRCPYCGHSFPNPKISFDCAQWCEHAEKCLGTLPGVGLRTPLPETAFAGRLLKVTEDLFARNDAPGSPNLLVFQHARELVSKQPCNPRLILAAALVLELEAHLSRTSAGDAAAKHDRPAEQPSTEQVLGRFGMDDMDIRCVHEVLERFRREPTPADIETKIVCDAVALAQLTLDNSRGEIDEVKPRLDELMTPSGKERAQTLFGG